ncbi:MAG: asparagine synthase (glutamine-hydrolyzing) [Oscillospiraceae bacterium]|jgi:asparagine synthase (glutamine-hydrolysing)|nr:asparagine synthase (glutamine-hydrolyzing) [Oscillospiraceae bacterium]
MCGIAGMCAFDGALGQRPEAAKKNLDQMAAALAHRGPDGSGVFLDGPVGLAHTRLAIIDPGKGTQPMVRRETGRTCALTYNGELYNTAELRAELTVRGQTWETTSDTEVLLAGLMRQGPQFVRKINGIFAFAYWDGKQLLLVRDRLGVKPLFYAQNPQGSGTLLFGSEPKALFAAGLRPALDDAGRRELFALGPAHTPGTCVFRGVRELLPGQLLVASAEGCRTEMYWQLESWPHTDSPEETVERTAFLVRDAVERQMVSDVPICTFLSGGLDSSLVSAICARKLAERGQRLATFSFDFRGNEEYYRSNAFQPSRDAPYAAEMAAYLDSEHTELDCDSQELADWLDRAVDARDMPGMADIDASLLYFCHIVGKRYKVTLTGESADEIFGGYPWFRSETAFQEAAFPWSRDMAARETFLRDDVLERLRLREYARAAYDDSVAQTPRLADDSPEEARRREITWLNLRWFLQTLLETGVTKSLLYAACPIKEFCKRDF